MAHDGGRINELQLWRAGSDRISASFTTFDVFDLYQLRCFLLYEHRLPM